MPLTKAYRMLYYKDTKLKRRKKGVARTKVKNI